MSLHEWAESFNVLQTWVEQWAQDALDSWHKAYLPAPVKLESGELTMRYPGPRIDHADADSFTFNLDVLPLAKVQHGITIGGDSSWYWERGEDDEAAFRRQMHGRLDDALDQFFRDAVSSGNSSRILIPTNLDAKIESAALYVLCGKTRDEIVAMLQGESTHVSAPTIYNWLKEAMDLLELKMRPRGHRPLFR